MFVTDDLLSVPPAAGVPSITQGVSGDRGNLELAYADPQDGLWVCWFNNDLTPVGDVGPGEWSSGLHFAPGSRYLAVDIVQASSGPDFIEVVAVTADAVERWTWSPAAGFEHSGSLAVPGARGVALAESDDGFVVCAPSSDGTVWVWRADAVGYPRLDWSPPSRHPLPADATRWTVRPTAGGLRAAVATPDGVLLTDDVEGEPWRPVLLGPADVSALCWVSPHTAGAEPALVVVAGGELATVSTEAEPSVVATGVVADDMAAATSLVDRQRLEVVTRSGTAVVHRRW